MQILLMFLHTFLFHLKTYFRLKDNRGKRQNFKENVDIIQISFYHISSTFFNIKSNNRQINFNIINYYKVKVPQVMTLQQPVASSTLFFTPVFNRKLTNANRLSLRLVCRCSSYVGFNGGGKWPMPVSLAQGCWKKGIVIHELGHALGMTI